MSQSRLDPDTDKQRIIAVSVKTTSSTFESGVVTPLGVSIPTSRLDPGTLGTLRYDVTRDGQQFVILPLQHPQRYAPLKPRVPPLGDVLTPPTITC